MKPGAKTLSITLLVIIIAAAAVYFFRPDFGSLYRRITGRGADNSGSPGAREEGVQGGAKVQGVFDGDTLAVELDGSVQIVQAIGINVPEAGNTGSPIECYAAQAHRRAVELLYGKSVELKADSDYPAEDGHGRLLRYIILPDGRVYNRTMLEEGMAYEHANLPQRAYQAQSEFRQAEAQAKIAALGLWATTACGG